MFPQGWLISSGTVWNRLADDSHSELTNLVVCIESQTLKSYTSCYAANIQKVHDVLNVVPFKTRSNLLKNKFFLL